MESQKFNFLGRELPSSLGYGILDEESVRFENGSISANYVLDCDGSIVHKVIWDKTRCELITELHGKTHTTSWFPDLCKALTSSFLMRDFAKDEVFDFLMERTCGIGNIYFQKPEPKGIGNKRMIYFPAGLLMSFRLPVPEKTYEYNVFLNDIKNLGYITFIRELKTFLLLADPEFRVTIKPLAISEFIVPLAFITSAAKIFAEHNHISTKKQYRLMIADSLQAEITRMQTYIGNEQYPFFAIYFADCTENNYPDLIDLFLGMLKGSKIDLFQKKGNTKMRDTNLPSHVEDGYNEETGEWEGENYTNPPQRERESWVSVTKDFKMAELEAPYSDNNLLLWIHKAFSYKTYDGGWSFKYELFTSDIQPMQLTEGGFTCIGIYDYCRKIGCGNYCTIEAKISDKNNIVRNYHGNAEMENGVIEVIEFMKSLHGFSDWKDYNHTRGK
jgi:hypothetical protein